MDFIASAFSDRSGDVLSSIILVALVLGGRSLAARYVRQQELANVQLSRRWLVQIRTITLLLIVFGLTVIWAAQLRSAAISLVALGAAFVLATKELIMCVSGSLVRTSAKTFTIGDRISVGDLRGDVIDHSLLATTMLEVGAGEARTGRTIVFPNSQLVTQAVVNETGGRDFVLHAFTVPVERTAWRPAADLLMEAAVETTADFVDAAAESFEERARRHALALPSVRPQVVVEVTSTTTINLVVRVPAPINAKGRIEQEILVRWLELMEPTPDGSLDLDTSDATGMIPRIDVPVDPQ